MAEFEFKKKEFEQEMVRRREKLQSEFDEMRKRLWTEVREKEAELNAKAERLMKVQQNLESHQQRTAHIINLNVGGRLFQTTLTTLTSEPDSMLAAMFSGRYRLDKDDKGNYFIDRRGESFGHIIDWLRTREVSPYLSEEERFWLLKEAQYYQLSNLEKRLIELTPVTPKKVYIVKSIATMEKEYHWDAQTMLGGRAAFELALEEMLQNGYKFEYQIGHGQFLVFSREK